MVSMLVVLAQREVNCMGCNGDMDKRGYFIGIDKLNRSLVEYDIEISLCTSCAVSMASSIIQVLSEDIQTP